MSKRKWTKPFLTQNDLEATVAHLSESEDDLEINSDSEDEIQTTSATEQDIPYNVDELEHVNIEELPVELEDGTIIFPTGDLDEASNELTNNDGDEQNKDINNQSITDPKQALGELKKMYAKLIWRKQNLVLNDETLAFRGNTSLPTSISDLETPFAFFKYFFDDNLFEKIASESNLYSIQKDPNKPAMLSATDIRQYLGICIYMSVVHMPNVRSYWSTNLGFSQIKNTMSQKRFEFIRQHLHFNDNNKMLPKENPDHDRLHKLRPVIDAILKKIQSVPLEKCVSVDEQLCATKAHHHLKQYLPAKPHKWGYKLYVLCGTDGFSYNFEIYTGDENQAKYRQADERDLGSSSNIVVRLCRIIPRNQNFRVYFDNFYTSVPLLVELSKRGIFSLGTVRRQRIPNCKLPTEVELKKQPRGTCHEYVCNVDGVDVTSIIWLDNKPVTLLSTFQGKLPLKEIRRWDRKQKKYINIECPSLIPEYNAHMGGVDAMDSYIGRNKIKMRTKKWYMRLFYHLTDMCLVNTWLLYKRSKKLSDRKAPSQVDVRLEIAECLCRSDNTGRKRGRPSQESVEKMLGEKRKRSATTCHVPPKDVRCDAMNHWPIYDDARQRCKFPSCSSFSHFKCSKCGVHLCLNKNHNCFMSFHQN